MSNHNSSTPIAQGMLNNNAFRVKLLALIIETQDKLLQNQHLASTFYFASKDAFCENDKPRPTNQFTCLYPKHQMTTKLESYELLNKISKFHGY